MKCNAAYCHDPEVLTLDIEILYGLHVFCMSDDLLEMIHNADMPAPLRRD